MSSLVKPPLLAIVVASLSLWAASAQAGSVILVDSHFLQADTSVSDEQERRVDAVDGTRFDGSVVSQGLGTQGRVGTASALQDVRFDRQLGASGFVESSVVLGSGISGSAQSLLFVAFELAGLSHFALEGFTEADGNAAATRSLSLLRDVDGGADVELFDFDFSTSSFSLSGLLDAGRYLFVASSRTDSADPGENGRNRIDFDLRFDAVPGGNNVPEPGSLALAAAALGLLARVRRGRGA
jgi:PEP-CTERM motif